MDRYLLQLMLSKGIGDAAIKKILNSISLNNGLSFKEYCKDSVLLQKVLFRPGTIDETMQSIISNESEAEKLAYHLEKRGVTMITEAEDGYPERLKNSLGKDCPPVLFLKGNIELLSSCGVGFCGYDRRDFRGW